MTQANNILQHMKAAGSITALDALSLYGCFRLAARIKDLRDAGHNIVTHNVTINDKTIAQYQLIQGNDHA